MDALPTDLPLPNTSLAVLDPSLPPGKPQYCSAIGGTTHVSPRLLNDPVLMDLSPTGYLPHSTFQESMDPLPTDLPLPNNFPAVMGPSLAVSPRFFGGGEFICPFPGCLRSSRRIQDTTRHISAKHLPDSFCCSQAGCDWTGNRIDSLNVHFRKRHPDTALPENKRFIIYDAPGLVRQLLDKKVTTERVEFVAQSLFKNWALKPTFVISVG